MYWFSAARARIIRTVSAWRTVSVLWGLLVAVGCFGSAHAQIALSTATWASGAATSSPPECLAADFNNDGATDLVCGFGSPQVSLSTASATSGFTTSTWSGATDIYENSCYTGNFLGSGKAGLACWYDYDNDYYLSGNYSTGSNFTQVWATGYWYNTSFTGCLVGNFTTGGAASLACNVTGSTTWTIFSFTSTGVTSQNWTGGYSPAAPAGNHCVTGDFNGDGLTDIACYTGSGGNWSISLSTGKSFATAQTWSSGVAPGNALDCFDGDFTGDGMADIACWTGSTTTGQWAVALSTGTSFNTVSTDWTGPTPNSSTITNNCLTGDFGGDGRMSIACYNGSGNWTFGLANGAGFTNETITSSSGGQSPSEPLSTYCLTGDFINGGLTDIACNAGGSSNWTVSVVSRASGY